MKADAVIVGGGPAGLLTAKRIGEMGYKPHIYEMNPEIGVPNHCAGLLSKEGLEKLWGNPDRDFIQNEVKGGKIFSPSGECISILEDRVRAYVVDRELLDKSLAEQAENHGAVIHKGEMVKGLSRDMDSYNGVNLESGRIETEITIDAEGPNRLLLRKAGLIGKNCGLLGGVNIEVSGLNIESEMVEVWFNNELAPGFFTWVIPLSQSRARCGLARRGGKQLIMLKKFISRRFEDPKIHRIRGGMVVVSGPISRTYYDGLLIVGDAAGQVKPTTGGGVILGGECASIAGEVAAEAIDTGDTSASFLAKYEKSWKEKLDKQFRYMLLLRQLIDRLDNETLDDLFSTVKREGLDSEIQKYVEDGDMDLQADVIKRGLKNPRILSTGMRVLGGLGLKKLKEVINL